MSDSAPRKRFVSIVVPALNEELTIGEFVDWCSQGLKSAGVEGEILIVDSSTDRTAEIAEAHGARVLRFPKGGLGQAYIDAVPHIKGEYIIMGDCDLTYDFRELGPFVEKLDHGYEYVMGSRFKGYIESGAMPKLHRYFGTPLTTFILNVLYGSHFSDIHCGMRAMTREALERISLESTSWQYASEMLLKSVKLGLKTAEVPIRFYKDREGRLSHMKRGGFLEPWKAGWLNLQVMLTYAPDFFLVKPGALVFLLGLVLSAISDAKNPAQIGPIRLTLHSLLIGIFMVILGYSSLFMGYVSRVIYDFAPAKTAAIKRLFSYNRGVAAGVVMMAAGLVAAVIFVAHYVEAGFVLENAVSKPLLFGILVFVLGFQTFCHTIMLNMVVNKNDARLKQLRRAEILATGAGGSGHAKGA